MIRLDVEVETVFVLKSLSTGDADERMHQGRRAVVRVSCDGVERASGLSVVRESGKEEKMR